MSGAPGAMLVRDRELFVMPAEQMQSLGVVAPIFEVRRVAAPGKVRTRVDLAEQIQSTFGTIGPERRGRCGQPEARRTRLELRALQREAQSLVMPAVTMRKFNLCREAFDAIERSRGGIQRAGDRVDERTVSRVRRYPRGRDRGSGEPGIQMRGVEKQLLRPVIVTVDVGVRRIDVLLIRLEWRHVSPVLENLGGVNIHHRCQCGHHAGTEVVERTKRFALRR